jgi:hypothetical protein
MSRYRSQIQEVINRNTVASLALAARGLGTPLVRHPAHGLVQHGNIRGGCHYNNFLHHPTTDHLREPGQRLKAPVRI